MEACAYNLTVCSVHNAAVVQLLQSGQDVLYFLFKFKIVFYLFFLILYCLQWMFSVRILFISFISLIVGCRSSENMITVNIKKCGTSQVYHISPSFRHYLVEYIEERKKNPSVSFFRVLPV